MVLPHSAFQHLTRFQRGPVLDTVNSPLSYPDTSSCRPLEPFGRGHNDILENTVSSNHAPPAYHWRADTFDHRKSASGPGFSCPVHTVQVVETDCDIQGKRVQF
jgi:hypothetical protein